MRLMTYNIRLGIQQGLAAVADVVRRHQPDLLALQEVGRHWQMGPTGDTAADLAGRVGMDHHAFLPCITETLEADEQRASPQACYGHALLSRYPIVDRRKVELPRHIDEPRAVLLSQVEAPGGPIDCITTHLSHRASERPPQGERLVELVDDALETADRLLVMGDLNDDTDESDWLSALKTRLDDAGRLAPEPTFPSVEPIVRIDYIFAYGGQFTEARVPSYPEPSDHNPLIADIDWL